MERALSYAKLTGRPLDLLLCEPETLGVGVHRCDQPDYLLLNTVAGQITAFPDATMVPDAPVTSGPSFLTWCAEQNAVIPASWSFPAPTAVAGHHFLPRRLYGEYLTWAASDLLAKVPACARISIASEAVVDVRPAGRNAELTLAGGTVHRVDLAVITTGHGLHAKLREKRSENGWIERCYPLPEKVAGVAPGQEVAIAGMGLTAVDIIAALTVGRGGRFEKTEGTLRYKASGQEPRMVLFNRRGWLPCARPSFPRRSPAATATALTLEAIEELRGRREGGLLSYRDDLEPLIQAEVETEDLGPLERRTIKRVLERPAWCWASEAEFHAAVIEQAELDIAQSTLGLGVSRIKDRLEALRDQREVLRAVVDLPGLTPEGHRDFFRTVPGLANRAAVGPQRERLEELLSLIDADVVRLGPGPNPRLARDNDGWLLTSTALKEEKQVRVDMVVKAHTNTPELDGVIDPLSASLRDWASPHAADPRYLALHRDGRVLTPSGREPASVAVFGPPAEGANYYNNYVLWPRVWSRSLTDIDTVMQSLFLKRRSV